MNKGKWLFSSPRMMLLVVVTLVLTYSIGIWPDVSASSDNGKAAGKPTTVPAKVPVDKDGFDSKGRMVVYIGSPLIDREVDDVWKKAPKVTPKHVSTDNTSTTFKALWDDDALYILAEVKDEHLSVKSDTLHMQDSVEIFLDENNDKTQEYGVDDLHIRVNYENSLSVDIENAEKYYTSSKITECVPPSVSSSDTQYPYCLWH
ncbi:sugar-binding protein [Gracilibacillus suaedae]|uniref:sugar-binding protein n=1 Tax=Gracilibacillus suaedae TaxID=2820273 RepID=UPI001ABE2378|nr:sugar-binding protein [Gracilibacillus suaedae]